MAGKHRDPIGSGNRNPKREPQHAPSTGTGVSHNRRNRPEYIQFSKADGTVTEIAMANRKD